MTTIAREASAIREEIIGRIALKADAESITCTGAAAEIAAETGVEITPGMIRSAAKLVESWVAATFAKAAPAKKEAPAAEPKRERIVVKERAATSQFRTKIFGHATTAVIRWMGWQGWSFEDASVALADHGAAKIADATIRIQLKAGRDGLRGPVALLSKSEAAALERSRN